ncbi:MAG TPA: SUMF1/EgtB/PvdO family nonheme iron enzyme [Pseudolabrys sp.]|nr:SUMF1/EgtB/PvdO family nonheme iron enzyme [Pseudolabrys sp.]
MLLAMKLKLAVMAGALAAPLVAATLATGPAIPKDPNIAELSSADFHYRAAGDFSRMGKPVEAPLHEARLSASLIIMKSLVTAADYARCIDAGACPNVPLPQGRRDVPITGVNWHDASAYAAWLTRKTGMTHRLPSDEEWVFAAAEKAQDEALPVIDPVDPAQAWIARYEAEAARAGAEGNAVPQPIGSFGRNSNGLLDVAGNVWEWTSSCYIRTALDIEGHPRAATTNCGVRVVEGAHRTYMTDFIRDPRTGGCASGVPPANLGFRLVIEKRSFRVLGVMDSVVRALGPS